MIKDITVNSEKMLQAIFDKAHYEAAKAMDYALHKLREANPENAGGGDHGRCDGQCALGQAGVQGAPPGHMKQAPPPHIPLCRPCVWAAFWRARAQLCSLCN